MEAANLTIPPKNSSDRRESLDPSHPWLYATGRNYHLQERWETEDIV